MTAMQLDAEDRMLFAATIERLAMVSNALECARSGLSECDGTTWSKFAAHGLLALGIDPEFGGVGGEAQDLAMVMHHVGRNLLAIPFLDTVVLGGTAIAQYGSSEQKHRLLPPIVAGDLRISLANREPAGGDDHSFLETRISANRLSGTKVHVLGGRHCHQFLVTARDAVGATTLCLVDPGAPGVELQHYRLPDNRIATKLVLAQARAEPLGGGTMPDVNALFQLATGCIAAETVGTAEAIFAETLAYAKVRRQFGQPIGSFQVIQHRLVDMFIAQQTAAATVADALRAIDAGGADASRIVAAAKAQADRAGRFIGESAIQIHGGMGMTDECAVGHYHKRILTNGSMYGTATWHVARLGSEWRPGP